MGSLGGLQFRNAIGLGVLLALGAPVFGACSSSGVGSGGLGTGGSGAGLNSTTTAATGSGGSQASTGSSGAGGGNTGCVSNSDCAAPTNVCDVAKGVCVECLVQQDCSALPGTVCSKGQCMCSDGGDTLCGASGCVDLSASVDHCGACSSPCSVANGKASCVSGQCQIGACDVGFGDCNMSGADGCEVNTSTDLKHCGACKKACPNPGNGKATWNCVSGACGIASCEPSYGDCDKNPQNGCEHLLTDDPKNCGACGKTCALAEGCSSGKCVPVCRVIGALKWCVNPTMEKGLSCNDTCASVGSTPIASDSIWFAAQDTTSECQNIQQAFQLPGGVDASPWAPGGCARYALEPIKAFLCNTAPQCASIQRANGDAMFVSFCPCK